MKVRVCLSLVFLLLVACGKNEFLLLFNLPEDISDNYNVTYYAAAKDGGVTIQAVASVMKGKCELKGVTKLPTVIYLTTRKSKYPLVIYTQKGEKIDITGTERNPLGWDVGGNDINISLSAWRKENLKVLDEGDAEKVNKAVEIFVNDKRENPAALIILFSYFNRAYDERLYNTLLGQLKDLANKDKFLMMMGRADQLTARATLPAKIKNLAMRSSQGGVDTLSFLDSNPGIIMFWQNDIKQRKELIDSLKVLVKEFPDSNSRIIADINLDPDSLTWRTSLKKDSLNKTVRLWAPAGLADVDVMKLKISGIPYFLVLDENGNQIYRGAELGDAMKKFRETKSKIARDSI